MRATPTLLLLVLATPALASDGALEINQTCAVNTGCFPGDPPGFPVSISPSAGGSNFVLTSDLTVPDENTDAISVALSYTTLDLGGFSIQGVTTCVALPSPVTCSPLGTGVGISVGVGTLFGVTVRNGVVRNMGSDGLRLLGTKHVVHDLIANENGGDGISVGAFSRIMDCAAIENGGDGMGPSGTSSKTYRGNFVVRNGGYGIQGSFPGSYADNDVFSNFLGQVDITAARNAGGNFCFGTGAVSPACP